MSGGARGARAAGAVRRLARALALALATAAAGALGPARAAAQPPDAGPPPLRSEAPPLAPPPAARGAVRLDAGRFTVVAYAPDLPLARSLLTAAAARDTFPGLPRPAARVLLAVAPDARRFREWVGPAAPEWGAAIAIPSEQRIVMQGRSAGSDAGDPLVVLRHELAHLALHEFLGELPSRWFDEGYASFAAGEWGRDETLATNFALLARGMPSLDSLEAGFYGGARRAEESYALAHRAVADLAALDAERGLSLFFRYWREGGRFDAAVRSAFGVTQAGFEQLWQQRTRRRYGILALVGNLSLVMGVFGVLFVPLWAARRRRDRARLEALRAADEAAEREERESALAALLAEPAGAPGEERRPAGPPGGG